jgi:hypothetical protein
MYAEEVKVLTRMEARGPLMRALWTSINIDILDVVNEKQVTLLGITARPHRATQDDLEAVTRVAHVTDVFSNLSNLTRD